MKPKTQSFIPPVKYDLNSKFFFECHKDRKCFTKCCHKINIILTPYDILRLKKKLEISSDEFLSIYTKLEILEDTNLPVVTLRLLDEKDKPCPFVRNDGCLVYSDRPSACRYYPVGTASLSHKEAANKDEFFFFVKEKHCEGFDSKKEWTVAEWRKDQGVDIHDEINADWTDLIVRKRTFTKNIQLTDKSKKMFFMASYSIDAFRRFVFESEFLNLYKIDDKEIQKIKNDDIELLKFGLRWLKWMLFKQGDFKLNEAKATIRKKKIEK